MKTPILQTQRLVLRPIELADAPRIQILFDDWEVVKWLAAAIPWPYPADGAETFLQHTLSEIDNGDRYVWAITELDEPTSKLIGIIDLFPQNPDDNRGFWLGSEFHRQGYMTEAVVAVNDFAFDVLGLEYLLLNNAEPNLGSHRLKEKSGAEVVEVRDDVPFIGGRFRNIRWKLTRETWHRNRHNFLK